MKRSDSLGELIKKRHTALRGSRSTFEDDWEDTAKFLVPIRTEFRSAYFGQERPPERDVYVTDSTGPTAMDNFSGSLFSLLVGSPNWATMKTEDDDLNQFQPVKLWLEDLDRALMTSFSPERSSFYHQVPELLTDCPGFGTGVFFSEYIPGEDQIFDASFSLFSTYIDVDAYNRPIGIIREMGMTAHAAMNRFNGHVPQYIRNAAENHGMGLFQFLHAIYPNDEFIPGILGKHGMPYIDVYVDAREGMLAQDDGRNEFPYQTPRWRGTQTYGYGIGSRNLPDAKTVNVMDNDLLEAAEWQAAPGILLGQDDALSKIRPVPREPIYGGLDWRGNRLVDFFQPQGNVTFSAEQTRDRRQQLQNAFLFSLMQLQGRTGLNPREFLELNEERLRLMGPNLARVQGEFLAPLLKTRFSMLWRRGKIPPPPPEIQDMNLTVNYESPMAAAQRASTAQSTLRVLDATLVAMQVDPSAADNVNVDKAMNYIPSGFGAPADLLRSQEQVDELRQRRAEMQAQQADIENAQTLADAAQKASTIERGSLQ